MRIFNFLLASDAVGGLGPPADLINRGKDTTANTVFLVCMIVIIVGIIIFLLIKALSKTK